MLDIQEDAADIHVRWIFALLKGRVGYEMALKASSYCMLLALAMNMIQALSLR